MLSQKPAIFFPAIVIYFIWLGCPSCPVYECVIKIQYFIWMSLYCFLLAVCREFNTNSMLTTTYAIAIASLR